MPRFFDLGFPDDDSDNFAYVPAGAYTVINLQNLDFGPGQTATPSGLEPIGLAPPTIAVAPESARKEPHQKTKLFGTFFIGAAGLSQAILSSATVRAAAAVVVLVALLVIPFIWKGRPLLPWKKYRKVFAEILAWLILSLGIIARQGIDLDHMLFRNVSLVALLISIVIGLCVFPFAMRLVNKFNPQPGLETIAFPFAFGFFLDMARLAAVHWVPALTPT